MKRKLISFAIAFAMLSQTMVFAGALYDALNAAGLAPITDSVVTTIESKVKGSGDAAFSAANGDTAYQNFDYQITLKMNKVRDKFDELYLKGSALTGAELTAFNASTIEGEFEITFSVPDITWSGAGSDAAASLKTALDTQLAAVNSGIYTVKKVTVTPPSTVVVEISTSGKTVAQFQADRTSASPSYLEDITLSLTGLTASDTKSEITADLTKGETKIYDGASSPYSTITYTAAAKSSNLVYNTTVATNSGGGGGGSITPVTPPDDGDGDGDGDELVIVIDSDSNIIDGGNSSGKKDEQLKIVVKDNDDGTKDVEVVAPEGAGDEDSAVRIVLKDEKKEKEGFIYNGSSTDPLSAADPNYNGTSDLGVVPVGGSVTVYDRYVNVTIPEAFENPVTEDGVFVHKPYINGYPDGEVKPTNNMSREEVATAFVNILNDKFKETYATTEQNFPDVSSDRWSNDPIALLTNAGILVGDDNGNFNPSKPITRAEFAVIASKFAPADAEIPENYFNDIDDHWAKDYILTVYGQSWVKGDGKGSFNPDEPITRAEVIQIINTMYTRFADYTAEDNTKWSDLPSTAWYFNAVMDATTENTFTRKENGWSEERVEE